MLAIAGRIEHPLGDRAQGGNAGASLRERVFRGDIRSPPEHVTANGRKVAAEIAAQIAHECPELRTQLVFSKQAPQRVVRTLEEVLADIAQKVEMTAEHGDLHLELSDKVLGGSARGTAQITHDRARRTEAPRHVEDVWRDLIGPFRG